MTTKFTWAKKANLNWLRNRERGCNRNNKKQNDSYFII